NSGTTAASSGARTVPAGARGTAGNIATSVPISVTMGNSLTSTPKNVIWINRHHAIASGSTLKKTGGCDGCAGGAVSKQTLPADGYLQFTASETGTLRYVGLGTDKKSTSSIPFAFAL